MPYAKEDTSTTKNDKSSTFKMRKIVASASSGEKFSSARQYTIHVKDELCLDH